MAVARSLRWRRRVVLDSAWEAPAGGEPRVAICGHDGAMTMAASSVLVDDGCEVRACAGPDEGHACALLATGTCPLVEGADAVVALVGAADGEEGELLDALRHRYPDVPLVAHVAHGPTETVDGSDDDLVLRGALRGRDLVERVEVALARRSS